MYRVVLQALPPRTFFAMFHVKHFHANVSTGRPAGSEAAPSAKGWWARQDLNLQPHRYERRGATASAIKSIVYQRFNTGHGAADAGNTHRVPTNAAHPQSP